MGIKMERYDGKKGETQRYHSFSFWDLGKSQPTVCVQRGDSPNQLKLLPLIQRGSMGFAFFPQFN